VVKVNEWENTNKLNNAFESLDRWKDGKISVKELRHCFN
jgi:Ca2+-binding EF-hand superfamily protein